MATLTPAQAQLMSTPDLEYLAVGLLSGDATAQSTLADRWSLVAPSGKRAWFLSGAGASSDTSSSLEDARRIFLDSMTALGRAWATGSNPDRWRSWLVWTLSGSLPS